MKGASRFLIIVLILIGAIYFSYSYDLLKSPEINADEEVVISDLKEGQEAYLTGSLETIVYDEEIPRYEYFIDNNGEKTQIWFTEPILIISGTLVNLNVKFDGEKLIADPENLEIIDINLQPSVVSAVPLVPETIGEQRTAVILVRFNDSTSFPFTAQQINNSIFNGPIQNFIRENSFNQTWLSGNTYGWYTLNRSCNDQGYAGIISPQEAIDSADTHIYYPNIDRLIFISDAFCYSGPTGSGTVGKVTLNSNDGSFIASWSTIRNSVFFYQKTQLPSGARRTDGFTSGIGLTLHELGHNFGAGHSNNIDCGNQSLGVNCVLGNYGNVYDIMGKAWITGTPIGYGGANFELYPHAAFHYGGIMKKEFKWIAENKMLNVISNGTYTLRPLEKTQATIAKISLSQYLNYPSYWLEYRIPFGYDYSLNDPLSLDNLGGVFINRQSIFGSVPSQYLLDNAPTTSDPFDTDWYNVSLKSGRTFFDIEAGIKITNVTENLSNPNDPKVSFNVEFYNPVCISLQPDIEVTPLGLGGIPYVTANNGTLLNLTNRLWIDVQNWDRIFCPNSTFIFEVNNSNNWNYRFDQADVILTPELFSGSSYFERTEFFEINIPANATAGYYNVSLKTTNVNSRLFNTDNFVVRIL